MKPSAADLLYVTKLARQHGIELLRQNRARLAPADVRALLTGPHEAGEGWETEVIGILLPSA
jgi:hypothetical protein